MDKIPLSARGYTRILKWARTIPDLADSLSIESPFVTEAVPYLIWSGVWREVV